MRTDKDRFVRERALTGLARGECQAFFPKLVDDVARVELKKDTPGTWGVDPSYGEVLKIVCRRTDVDTKLRVRAGKAATRLAEAKSIHDTTRTYALESLVVCDAAAAKSVAAKLVNDPVGAVASKAKEIAQ